MQISIHLLPILFLIIEMLFNNFTYYLWLYVFPAILGTAYMIINISYSLVEYPLYKVLSWKDPMSYGIGAASYLLPFLTLGGCRLIAAYWKEKRIVEN